jgi:ATP-dependent helicase/nuclease subunit B
LIPFLKTFAKDLWNQFQPDLSKVCVVLPNRRGALFLKEYLAEEAKKTIFSPEIFSTEDFVYKLSGLQIIDNTELLFELYAVYSETMAGEADSFELFSKWAPALIADFNEIDRYLVDARQLFINLSSIREIENWSLNSTDLSPFQQNYIRFWESLGHYYHTLRAKLEAQNKAWQGLAYRYVAENIDKLAENQPWKMICFAGFNALNAAEEKIINQLLRAGKAQIRWDADEYYLGDQGQEAGKFLRRYRSEFHGEENPFRWTENNLLTGTKTVKIIGAAKNITQAKLAGTLLQQLQKENASLRSTALVLADENLLFPVLNSIPEEIREINVTMGYPLRSTAMATLFQALFRLHVNSEKYSKGRKGEKRFYHEDLCNLLRHPYLRQVFRESDITETICKYILKNNVIFIGYRQIEKTCKEQHSAEWNKLSTLLLGWMGVNDAFPALENMVMLLRDTFQVSQGPGVSTPTNVETELLFQFHTFLKRIHSLCMGFPYVSELKTLQTLFDQLANSSTIPFYGEPLSGLQVMGMLETRTLDFENIILLSANENILPSGKPQNSFIPHDLKKLFGLPMYADKDAVFAYHFYRLIQRAKNIFLLYNTESDKFGDGEKSRYITQLINEVSKLNPRIQITEALLELHYGKEPGGEIVIPKDVYVIKKLHELAEQGFSPTLLNTFRKCPLKFYLHYVAGIREIEEVEEEIGADAMGSVIHEVLELLYAPFSGKQIRKEDLTGMKKLLDKTLNEVFIRYFPEEVLTTGKNLLTVRISGKFLHQFLEAEEKQLLAGTPLFLEELEKEMSAPLETSSGTVTIKGKADRIDRFGKDIRIIDYKTGKADNNELNVNDWESLLLDPKMDKGFQLLCYAWLYNKQKDLGGQNLLSGIITFRQLSAGLKTVKTPGKTDGLNPGVLMEFELILKALVLEIFNPALGFIQTKEVKNCEYCSFRTFCNR